jgi:hypothetical protein
MQLEDINRDLEDMPQKATAYVRNDDTIVSPSTEVVLSDGDERPPSGWRYFLEILVMKEVLWGWSFRHEGPAPSVVEACRAIIHYAEYDAHDPDD